MSNRLALGIGLVATFAASSAFAQEVTIGYQGLPYKASGESNTGIQVSDGVLLHVGVGAEVGYDSNVFYQNSQNALGSGLIRVLPWLELANASRTGPASRRSSCSTFAPASSIGTICLSPTASSRTATPSCPMRVPLCRSAAGR